MNRKGNEYQAELVAEFNFCIHGSDIDWHGHSDIQIADQVIALLQIPPERTGDHGNQRIIDGGVKILADGFDILHRYRIAPGAAFSDAEFAPEGCFSVCGQKQNFTDYRCGVQARIC